MKRDKSALPLLLVIVFVLLTSCRLRQNWIMFRGEQGRGETPNALYPPLGIKWKLRLQEKEEPTFAFNNPVVLGNTIFFGSTDGNFYALDIESGYMRWVYKTRGAINSIPFADQENIYFGSNDGKVYAVAQDDGREVWSFQTDSTVQSTVVRYQDLIIFSSDGGTTYFLNPAGVNLFSLPNPVWHYDTFQVYDDVMYFAPGPPQRAHSLGAFDLNQRSYLWILDTSFFDATWYSFPALSGDTLFMSTAAYFQENWMFNYYAMERKTGELIWKYNDISDWGRVPPTDSRALFLQQMKLLDYLAPSLWRNLVIYCSGDTRVRAFKAKSGRLAWERKFDRLTSSPPTVAGNRVYLGLRGTESTALAGDGGDEGSLAPGVGRDSGQSSGSALICLAANSGRLLWEMEVEGAILSAPIVAGKWMIFGTEKNVFYVLEELF